MPQPDKTTPSRTANASSPLSGRLSRDFPDGRLPTTVVGHFVHDKDKWSAMEGFSWLAAT